MGKISSVYLFQPSFLMPLRVLFCFVLAASGNADWFSPGKKAAETGGEKLKEAGDKLGKDAKEVAGQLGKHAKEVAGQLGNDVKEASGQLGKDAKEVAHDIKEGA